MAVISQKVGDEFAIYNGDCCEILPTVPDNSVHLSIYSPPFAADGGGCLYHYSSSPRDLSNCRTHEEFFQHYKFAVEQIHRVTLEGRFSAVHCMDIPRKGERGLIDFPGEIIRLHESCGWWFWARHFVWKEPLGVRNRTMARGLAHKTVIDDSSLCDVASADCVLLFRKKGDNSIPIAHKEGLMDYAGARKVPYELLQYRNWKGLQRENRLSHWIWRQYASAFWDDIRIDRVLPFKEGKEDEDERHMHPLQLDVIDRLLVLRSNPGEVVLTPFMGVGSEVYEALSMGRKSVGVELKKSYYCQALKNLKSLGRGKIASFGL
ncbi:site-specific DNA-methyltransferase [Candidatus Pacearchaeota archaeon]|jgi:DNA modification methylase|nr:site-specific DNA-methyltransferase [Candidatus Pacearchaeota archaeon]